VPPGLACRLSFVACRCRSSLAAVVVGLSVGSTYCDVL
jgi:hypothetical protein